MKTSAHWCAAAVSGCCFFSQLALAGSWVEVSGPVVPSSGIAGIGVLNDRDVWAVGSQNTGVNKMLAEHWDGRNWSVVPTPDVFPTFSLLNDVTTVAANDVWAVGYGAQGDAKTLAIHWDGSVWAFVPTPNLEFRDNYLNSVSAVSSTDVWAAGLSDTTAGSHEYAPLIMHWDGTAWTISTTPKDPGAQLTRIRALASNDVWAVGLHQNKNDFTAATTVTMHWNGTAWSLVPSPNGDLAINVLQDVTGVAGNDVWAVGVTAVDFFNTQTLSMHWDGVAWTVVATPVLTGSYGFTAAQATAANSVWAVGSVNGQSLIERWNGRKWAVAVLPPLQDPSSLSAISGGRMNSLWTTGLQSTGQLFLKMTR